MEIKRDEDLKAQTHLVIGNLPISNNRLAPISEGRNILGTSVTETDGSDQGRLFRV